MHTHARPSPACLHELFEAQVDRTPDAVAVALDSDSLSYRELDERSNQLARQLRQLGVQRETLVGLCVERSLEMVIGLLGILKAGAAYVPLDPTYPADRLAFMLGDTDAALLVTQQHLLTTVADRGRTKTLCLDRDWHLVSSQSAARASAGVTPDHLAYVIYTSGSSGRPKGVMVTHRSVGNVLAWLQERYPLTSTDAVVQVIPFAFDGAVADFYWPLLAGARLIMLRPDGHRDPDDLARVIDDHRCTTMISVPSMLSGLLDRPGSRNKLRSLRRVFCGGETLTPDLTRRFFAGMASEVELTNLYGPTETTVFVSAWRCEPATSAAHVPIGRPITDTQLYVLDDRMEPLPGGTTGELFVGGVGLARGYLNQQGLTAERFVPDPFGAPGARLYRTGDLARRLPDGVIEHLGRVDSQVKLRGFRIELGEIEATLHDQPGVRDAVVLLRADPPGEARLVGHVVAHPGHELSPDALTKALEQTLPAYMVPSSIVLLDALPLTPHGKVDRDALLALPSRRSRPRMSRLGRSWRSSSPPSWPACSASPASGSPISSSGWASTRSRPRPSRTSAARCSASR